MWCPSLVGIFCLEPDLACFFQPKSVHPCIGLGASSEDGVETLCCQLNASSRNPFVILQVHLWSTNGIRHAKLLPTPVRDSSFVVGTLTCSRSLSETIMEDPKGFDTRSRYVVCSISTRMDDDCSWCDRLIGTTK